MRLKFRKCRKNNEAKRCFNRSMIRGQRVPTKAIKKRKQNANNRNSINGLAVCLRIKGYIRLLN